MNIKIYIEHDKLQLFDLIIDVGLFGGFDRQFFEAYHKVNVRVGGDSWRRRTEGEYRLTSPKDLKVRSILSMT